MRGGAARTSCSSRSAPPPACAPPTPSSPARCGARARRRGRRRRARGARAHARADRPRAGRAPRARRAPSRGCPSTRPRAVLYSTTTAALLWPRPGAIRFDAPRRRQPAGTPRRLAAPARAPAAAPGAAAVPGRRRPGRGRRTGAPTRAARRADPGRAAARRAAAERDVAAITYARQPAQEGARPRPRAAWARARRPTARSSSSRAPTPRGRAAAGVRARRRRSRPPSYRALLRRARVFVDRAAAGGLRARAARGARRRLPLVTTPAPGPYAALPLARALDPRLVGDDLGAGLRGGARRPAPGYAERALRRWRRSPGRGRRAGRRASCCRARSG